MVSNDEDVHWSLLKRICTAGSSRYKFLQCNIVLVHHLWSFELVPYLVDCNISTIDLEWWRISVETSRLLFKVCTCWSLWYLFNSSKSIFCLFLYFLISIGMEDFIISFMGGEEWKWRETATMKISLQRIHVQVFTADSWKAKYIYQDSLTSFIQPCEAGFYLVLQLPVTIHVLLGRDWTYLYCWALRTSKFSKSAFGAG